MTDETHDTQAARLADEAKRLADSYANPSPIFAIAKPEAKRTELHAAIDALRGLAIPAGGAVAWIARCEFDYWRKNSHRMWGPTFFAEQEGEDRIPLYASPQPTPKNRPLALPHPKQEQAAINPWTGREPEPEPAAGPQPAEPAAAPQAQPSTAEYLRRTAIPKPDPDFHKRADEPPQAQPAIAPNCPYDRGPMGAYFSGWRCAACGSQVEIIADLRALARSPEPAPPVVMQGAVQANNRQVDVLQNALHPEPAPISDERITLRIVLAEWDRLGADTQKMAVVGFKFAAAVRALLAEKGKP